MESIKNSKKLKAKPKRRTHEEFIQIVNQKHNNEYEILGEYKTAHSKINVRHNKCGREYITTPNHLVRGHGCKECSKVRKTPEEFIKEIHNKTNGEYSVLSEYKNTRTKVLMKHNACGHEWQVLVDAFLYGGSRCPTCSKKRAGELISERLRKTHEEFVQEVYELVENEYAVLGQYKLTKTKLKMRHNVCGNEWQVVPHNFLVNGNRCPKCSLEKRTITKQEFLTRIQSAHGEEYSLIGEYVNMSTKLQMRHNKCGYEWLVYPYSLSTGTGCPKCAEKYKITTEIFSRKVNELTESEAELISEFIDYNTKVEIKYKTCGHTRLVSAASFYETTNCTECSRIKRSESLKKGSEEYKKEIDDLYPNQFLLLSEYKGSNEKIKVKHLQCGHEWEPFAPSLLSKGSCPNCSLIKRANDLRISDEEFIKRVSLLGQGEYETLESYKTMMEKILFKHKSCGHEWMLKPHDFIVCGVRCPRCKESKGENKIRTFLEHNYVKYKTQHRIKECKNKLPLPFDFACFDNKRLICLIEYDGIQHFESSDYFGGKDKLTQTQTNDEIKNDYCMKNNIPLIRIKYTEIENIENILKQELSKLDLIKEGQLTFDL